MNRITLKYRILLLTFLVFSVCAVNALTLNPLIEAPEGHTLINQKPLLFNEQIIFVTEKDDDYTLWAYDLTNDSFIGLHTFDNYFYPNFFVIDNIFHFIDGSNPKLLWQSDGTIPGTKRVGNFSLYRGPLSQRNDLIFMQSGANGNTIIVYDGQSSENYYEQSHPMHNAACGFSVKDVIIPGRQPNSYQHILSRYQPQGNVDYSGELPQDSQIDLNRVWYFENRCFYHINGRQFSDVLVIPEQGEHYFLGNQLGFSEVNFLIRFKDHYYMMADDEDRDNYIVKLSSDLSTVVKQVKFDTFGIVNLTASADYLIAYTRTGGNVSPPAWKSGYFDENLNEITGLGGPFTDVPEIYFKDGGEIVVFNDYINGIYQKTIGADISDKNSGLMLNGDSLKKVIVNEGATETYTLVKNLQTGQNSIKKLVKIPDMGALSVGNWFDPDYQSQGMSVVEGLRDDGSRYLFVTLYLFRDGEPLWLAGTSNINYPQPTLDIELGAYSGPGLWQPDTTAQVEKFADMTLSMSGCHQLMVNFITVDGQTFSLELQRMVNNDIKLYCKD